MQVDAFVIRLRRRSNMEAADMGVRLCQSVAGQVFACYLIVMLPVAVFCLASFEVASWIPTLALWWLKPWLDRTVLFVLSRAAFGHTTRVRDLWQAQRQVWWRQLLRTLTTRRLSPWRSYTQPVYQLEGQSGSKLRKRVAQIRSGHAGAALGMTSVFSTVEMVLALSLLSLAFWFAPPGYEIDFSAMLAGTGQREVEFAIAAAYTLAVAFLEPFYVAAGFAMYLDRRVELEAWDIEQEFRRAFTH
ncbi:MAG TPA: hypothetical protein VKB34_07895 [Povalibacter sp.]|nr:hypothetical protein [Povalibacter sp.]